MKVIFITDSYYPRPSPNAICVRRLKDEFERRGIPSNIITLRNFYRISEPYECNVKYVKPDILYSSWFKANENNNECKKKLLIKIFRLRGVINGFFWPLSSTTHIRRYLKAIGEELKKGDGETIIIGAYKSLEGAVAGAIAKKRFKAGKYILYSLDAMSGSVIPNIYGSKTIGVHSIKRWEKSLFKSYDYIYLMDSHASFYRKAEYNLFRNKFRFVGIPLFVPRINNHPCKSVSNTKRHMVFTGSMAVSTADPRYFLDLINAIERDDIIVDFYGKIFHDEILEKIKCSPYAKYHGTQSHEVILEIQQQADVLLNFGNFTPCGIPCKIFEYFSSGRKVISCYKIDDDASKPYIEKYPNSLLIDERRSKAENAVSLIKFLDNQYTVDSNLILETFKFNTPEATVSQIISDFYESRN
ncbi:MAG: hypothetical protein NC548_30070 [Lachnospiraceae bacterium]|nr:hypothetical protein [Lachnospiraceae bacterium]